MIEIVLDVYWLIPRLVLAVLPISLLSLLFPRDLSENAQALFGLAVMTILGAVVVVSMARWESSARRSSFGKLFMGVEVTDLRAQPVSFLRALGRNILKFALWPFSVTIVITPRREALHDRLPATS